MFGKNDVQKNFKKEMKNIERKLLKKRKKETGEPSNTFFNDHFYGQSNNSFGNKIKKVFNFLLSYGLIIIIAIFVIYYIFITVTNSTDKIYSSFEKKNYEDTIKYSDKTLENNPKHYDALTYKGTSYRILEDYQQSLEVFQIAYEHYPNDIYVLNELAYSNYSLGNYYTALENYNQVLEIDSEDIQALFWKGEILLDLYEYDEAIESLDTILDLYENGKALNTLLDLNKNNMATKPQDIFSDYNYAEIYNLKGLVFFYQSKYTDAIENFDKAIKSNYAEYKTHENAHLNKIYALFLQNDFQGCIDFSESIQEKFPNNSDIPYYIGDCYSFMGEYNEAIKFYEKAKEIEPENSWIFSDIAKQYLYLQDYENSKAYTQNAIEINSENYIAQELLNALEEANLPEAERIIKFVKENYLYLDKVEDFDIKAENFISKDKIEYKDIYEFIESIRLEDDLFTFFIWGDYYEEYIDEIENDEIEYKVLDKNHYYLRFDSFTQGISGKFSDTIKNIPSTEDSYLILDLRDNPGGLLFTAMNILDTLMPEYISTYTIDRDGYMNTYQTSYDHFSFKHIYILVNEDSASASEVIALSLKTYLPNVTIIGRKTYGKGVGQTVFENKENKYVIFLVNSFWNVKETNILGKGVQPDIIVNGTELEHFLDPMMIN